MSINLLNIKTPAQDQAAELRSDFGLKNHGLTNLNTAYWNLPCRGALRGNQLPP